MPKDTDYKNQIILFCCKFEHRMYIVYKPYTKSLGGREIVFKRPPAQGQLFLYCNIVLNIIFRLVIEVNYLELTFRKTYK